MEYLTTYGWAFLVILVAIGALAYFGLLSPSRWVPDKCDLGRQLECVDYEVVASDSSNDGKVGLYVKNNFGKTIKVTGASVRRDAGTLSATMSTSVVIGPGDSKEVIIANVKNLELQPGEKTGLVVNVTFQRDNPPGSPHTIIGVLYTTAK